MSNEIKVAIVAGILSFCGAIGGTVTSSYFSEARSRSEYTRQLRAEMLKTRLSVVEQCAKTRFHSTRLDQLEQYRTVENRRLESLNKATARAEQFAPTVFSLDMQREYAQLGSDQMTCALMASLLFGPETNHAALELSSATWADPANPKLSTFFGAMLSEVSYFDR